MKEFLKSNLFFKIVSVVIAVVLWLYVVQFENPIFQVSVSDIPVKFENEETLTSRDLIITSRSRDTVTLKVEGKRQTVSKLDKSSILAVIDLKSITSEGEYNLPVKVSFSENNIVVSDSSMPRIHITVESKVAQAYKVKLSTKGAVKEGYYPVLEKDSATVSMTAPESMAHLAASAQAELDVTGADSTVEDSAAVVLYDSNGNIVNSRYIKSVPNEVNVKCYVYPVKEIPVTWQEIGVKPVNAAEVVSSAKTIKVAGPEDKLSAISSLNIGTINLSELTDEDNTRKFSLKDNLALEGLYVAEDIKSVTLTLEFAPEEEIPGEQTETAYVTVDNITLQGVPEGYTAEVLASSVSVKVSGEKSVIESIKDGDIKASVDLSSLSEEELLKDEHELAVSFSAAENITFEEAKYVKVKITPSEEKNADSTEDTVD